MKTIKPENIICFALPAWEAEYLRSTVELMKGISAENKVLYVDFAYTLSDLFKGIAGKKKFEWKRLVGLKSRLQKVSGNDETGLYVLSLPPVLPTFIFRSYRLFEMANRINAAITGYFINRAIKKLQMTDILGINAAQPFLGLYWKIKNINRSVYYIYDDFSNVAWFNGFAKIDEEKFIDKVDSIIVSSDELKKRKSHFNKPVEVVNNGVHFNAFNKYVNTRKPDKRFSKTIGYTGTMDSRIDIDLLENVVKEMPAVRFLFVGKVFDKNISNRLAKYANVFFEKPVAAEKIPYIQSQMDAGIIPYVCNEFTAAIYPLKVNEYLSMGLPVVMTPFAALSHPAELVCRANDAKTFRQALELAITGDNDLLKDKRCELGRKADWSIRAKELMDFIKTSQPGFHPEDILN